MYHHIQYDLLYNYTYVYTVQRCTVLHISISGNNMVILYVVLYIIVVRVCVDRPTLYYNL